MRLRVAAPQVACVGEGGASLEQPVGVVEKRAFAVDRHARLPVCRWNQVEIRHTLVRNDGGVRQVGWPGVWRMAQWRHDGVSRALSL